MKVQVKHMKVGKILDKRNALMFKYNAALEKLDQMKLKEEKQIREILIKECKLVKVIKKPGQQIENVEDGMEDVARALKQINMTISSGVGKQDPTILNAQFILQVILITQIVNSGKLENLENFNNDHHLLFSVLYYLARSQLFFYENTDSNKRGI